jgi:hypothetical protein
VVEHVAIRPIRDVTPARAASAVIGSSQMRGACVTSWPTPSVSARKIESNSPASALRASSV